MEEVVVVFDDDLVDTPKEALLRKGFAGQRWQDVAGVLALRGIEEKFATELTRICREKLIKIFGSSIQERLPAFENVQVKFFPE